MHLVKCEEESALTLSFVKRLLMYCLVISPSVRVFPVLFMILAVTFW